MTAESGGRVLTRRRALKAAGGGLAAPALGAVVRPVPATAANGDTVLLGGFNTATSATTIVTDGASCVVTMASGTGSYAFLASGSGGGAHAVGAASLTGFALRTEGKVTFDTAGILKFPAGRQRRMADPGVPADRGTKVLATLLDAEGAGVAIDHVRRIKIQNRIQVILTGPPAVEVRVAWFVIS